ncbi:AmmeMemoRadiSam system protein A, partial [Candidatus Woesearchaeota archaeon]|nr:AmmeMemoRadiSam system protein A [Candidatus Woesearchaeota archaeon]
LEEASILDVTHYRTPLGEVKLSKDAEKLLEEEMIKTVPEAHAKEHCLEIELPFLQKKLTDLEVVPIIVGRIDPTSFKDSLAGYIDEKTLVVVSVDLSHYHPYEEAKQLDYYTIDRILSKDYEGIFKAEIDAPWAVSTLLMIAKEKGWKPYLLYYANSGDVSGDKSSVVGYAAMAFVDKGTGKERNVEGKADVGGEKEPSGELEGEKGSELSDKEKELLLGLARYSAENYLKAGKKTGVDESKLTAPLKKVQGCFTTFTKDDNLRGCIGHILPQEELYKCVMDNAINAALNDRRFDPVSYDEMKGIKIEISVLSVPEKVEFDSGDELLEKLRPMIDGVVLKQGFKQSTYLPQVWSNFNSKEEFLGSLCMKGGMGQPCWKDGSTEVHTYQAVVFGEE